MTEINEDEWEYMRIPVKKGTHDYKRGLILLDEAVGVFMHDAQYHENSQVLERVIGAIVREFDGCQDED
jgi:hypothetical protein